MRNKPTRIERAQHCATVGGNDFTSTTPSERGTIVTLVRDHFPHTPRTMVHDALERGDPKDVAGHLIRLYEQPLRIYFSATTFRNLGEPRDVISGFLADRLSRADWLASWKEANQSSKIPLRRWFLNALNFYIQEEARRIARDRRGQDAALIPDSAATTVSSAESQFDREAARSVVTESLRRARAACEAAAQLVHFEIFVLHFINDIPYELLAPRFGLTETQCAGHVRTASAKFRRAIAETLLDEGSDPATLNDEIALLMGALRS